MNKLVPIPPLPNLPIVMHPIAGSGLVETKLKFCRPFSGTPPEAMAAWRMRHRAEQSPYRALFWMKARDTSATVYFLRDLEGKRLHAIGRTINNPDAARILIANACAGRYLTPVRWELYADRACEDLLGIGRFDQWDFLADIPEEKLREFAERRVMPTGNWDFDHMLWPCACSVCGAAVSVNDRLFNIDSAVCAACGNRPYLAPSVHELLDGIGGGTDAESERVLLHVFDWLAHATARFGEVRRDLDDGGGVRLKAFWEKTAMARALAAGRERPIGTALERTTGFILDLYCGCVEKSLRALSGEEPFNEEHRITAEFVGRTTELFRIRQLTTTTE